MSFAIVFERGVYVQIEAAIAWRLATAPRNSRTEFLDELFALLELIRVHPELMQSFVIEGKPLPVYRALRVTKFVVLYYVDEEGGRIVVARVFHERCDLRRA